MESIFFNGYNNIKFCHSSPEIILKCQKTGYIIRLIDIFKGKNYIVYVKKRKISGLLGLRKCDIYTFLKVNADSNDLFLAFLVTVKINMMLQETKTLRLNYKTITEILEKANAWLEEVDKKFLFNEMKKVGWSLNFNTLEETFYRYHMLIKPL